MRCLYEGVRVHVHACLCLCEGVCVCMRCLYESVCVRVREEGCEGGSLWVIT